MIAALALLEDGIASLALAAMVVLPLAEIVVRRFFGVGIPGSGPFVQHLTLWIGFLGAAIAARQGKLLSLATGSFIPQGLARDVASSFASAVAACMALVLAWGGVQLAMSEREVGSIIAAGVPTWVGQLALPVGFALIAVRLALQAGRTGWAG
ncbi:MAG TPA: TRAP transporter small permease subunit, partial [Vicinamibacterales bacterium]|nr:TRAP transporter small permease subunit [Vicinamibacterales bacterium]